MDNNKSKFRPGVLYGEEVNELLNHARDNNYALPAVNVIGTNSVNAVLETAREVNSPVIIQFQTEGLNSMLGKGFPMKISMLQSREGSQELSIFTR